MSNKKNTSLDRVLGRLDRLDSVNLANLVQRLARERSLFEEIFNTLQEGVLVILGVDTLMDMARTSVNVLGNCLASAVVARWEGVEIPSGPMPEVVEGEPDAIAV